MKLFFICYTILVIPILLKGQPLCLKEFLDAEFFKDQKYLRDCMKRSVEDFKAIQHLYSEEDIAQVRDAYNEVVLLQNKLLNDVKEDLSDKKRRKFIRNNPEKYSKIFLTPLLVAKESFEDQYLATITEVTDGQITGGGGCYFFTTGYIDYKNKLEKSFRKIKGLCFHISEELLEKQIFEKYYFPYWDEIY